MRAKVEHPIGVIKRVFGFDKVRYRGLKKNARSPGGDRALANLFEIEAVADPATLISPSATQSGAM